MQVILRRAVAAGTGITGGIGLGLMIAERDLASVGAVAVLAVALAGIVRLVVPAELRPVATAIAGAAFAVRVAAVALVHAFAVDTGREWLYIVGDDRDYAMLSWNLVLYMRGQGGEPWIPPGFNGLTHLFGTFVYLETALFSLFGPDLQLVQTVNAFFGAVMVALSFDLGRRLFDARAATVAAGILVLHPSLVGWSALNLKEALASMLLTLVLRETVIFAERPGWRPLLIAYAALVPIESLRRYIFVGLDLVIPFTVLVAAKIAPWARVRFGAVSLVVTAVFLALNQLTLSQLGLMNILPTLEHSRTVMTDAARTGFVERPLIVASGETLVVTVASPAPAAVTPTPRPGASGGTTAPSACGAPVTRVVPPGTKLIVSTSEARPPIDDVVFVCPGDIIVVGPAGSTAAPSPRPVVLRENDAGVRLRQPSTSDLAIARTLSYLPQGLAYALGAPFPWALRRPIEALTVPEMLFWYVALFAAAITVWRMRARWRTMAPPVLFVLGTLAIFALAEGNYGTLFRHRGMVIPAVTVLAAPTFLALASPGVRRERLARGRVAAQYGRTRP